MESPDDGKPASLPYHHHQDSIHRVLVSETSVLALLDLAGPHQRMPHFEKQGVIWGREKAARQPRGMQSGPRAQLQFKDPTWLALGCGSLAIFSASAVIGHLSAFIPVASLIAATVSA